VRLQKNGAVSKVNKKSISHLIRVKRTPSAAATVQVSHVLPTVRFSCFYCGAAGPVFKMASQQEKASCVLHFEVSRSVITVQREFRARFRTLVMRMSSKYPLLVCSKDYNAMRCSNLVTGHTEFRRQVR
jgi:hypothetical protein